MWVIAILIISVGLHLWHFVGKTGLDKEFAEEVGIAW